MNKFVTSKYDPFEKKTIIKCDSQAFFGKTNKDKYLTFFGTLYCEIPDNESPIIYLSLSIQEAFAPYFSMFKDNVIYDNQLGIHLLIDKELYQLDLKKKYKEDSGNTSIANFSFSVDVLKKICESSNVAMRITCIGSDLVCDYTHNMTLVKNARAIYNAAIDDSLYIDFLS